MEGYTREQWQQAEAEMKKRAEEAAYKASEGIANGKVQLFVYKLTKDNIILGARMMEEELTKTEKDYDTEKTTD